MLPEQILILATTFLLAFFGYRFFEKRFSGSFLWLKHNALLLALGIAGAAIFNPFSYPYNMESYLRNLPVFTVIPICAFNAYLLVHDWVNRKQMKVFLNEVLELLAIVAGGFAGMGVIRMLHLGTFEQGDMEGIALIVFIFSLGRILFSYARLEKILSRKERELEHVRVREMQVQGRLDIVNARIQPHFLYNALNSIAGLASVDGNKTREMAIALAKLLRYSLENSDRNFVTLKEEAEILQTYFAIEQIRFGEALRCVIDIAEDAQDYLVPRFLLQPLAENCIKHAFAGSAAVNVIEVRAALEGGALAISIHDNGEPFPETIVSGYGFKTVTDKLQLLLPGAHTMGISNAPRKQILITIREPRTTSAGQQ